MQRVGFERAVVMTALMLPLVCADRGAQADFVRPRGVEVQVGLLAPRVPSVAWSPRRMSLDLPVRASIASIGLVRAEGAIFASQAATLLANRSRLAGARERPARSSEPPPLPAPANASPPRAILSSRVPEPPAFVLCGMGLAVLFALSVRRQYHQRHANP